MILYIFFIATIFSQTLLAPNVEGHITFIPEDTIRTVTKFFITQSKYSKLYNRASTTRKELIDDYLAANKQIQELQRQISHKDYAIFEKDAQIHEYTAHFTYGSLSTFIRLKTKTLENIKDPQKYYLAQKQQLEKSTHHYKIAKEFYERWKNAIEASPNRKPAKSKSLNKKCRQISSWIDRNLAEIINLNQLCQYCLTLSDPNIFN